MPEDAHLTYEYMLEDIEVEITLDGTGDFVAALALAKATVVAWTAPLLATATRLRV